MYNISRVTQNLQNKFRSQKVKSENSNGYISYFYENIIVKKH